MLKRVIAALIRFYRVAISPMTAPRCRFLPTCSDYALQAIERHGAATGGWLALRRLARCHPFNPGGLDEVPDHPPRFCSCRWPAALRGRESTER